MGLLSSSIINYYCCSRFHKYIFFTKLNRQFHSKAIISLGNYLSLSFYFLYESSLILYCFTVTLFRFYMVSGEKGWFPYGTDCSRGRGRRDAAYCVKVSRAFVFFNDLTMQWCKLADRRMNFGFMSHSIKKT